MVFCLLTHAVLLLPTNCSDDDNGGGGGGGGGGETSARCHSSGLSSLKTLLWGQYYAKRLAC